jgi:glutamine synthetase
MDEKNKWVKVGFTDIDGIFRGKLVHYSKFISSPNISYCDVVFGWDLHDAVYPEDSVSGWKNGFPDAKATIDHTTKRDLPWDTNPLYIIDFSDDNTFSSVCPRSLLKRVLEELKSYGYSVKVGFEYEWFNFKIAPETLKEPHLHSITTGMFGYSLTRLEDYPEFIHDLLHDLAKLDITLEGFHTETGPGVYEAAIRYDDALPSADRASLFKHFTKIIGKRHGILPSFMAKWNEKLPGCSGHIHISVQNQNGENISFSDPGKDQEAQHFLAGVIQYMDVLLPLYNPFVNSYKRLVSGSWAPTKAIWGIENRTASVRIIPGVKGQDRFELRIPGADANPYIALYACLKSGLQGVKNKIPLKQKKPVGNAYENTSVPDLPTNLGEAATRFYEHKDLRNWIDPKFIEHYYMTRMLEYNQYQRAVTDWELRRYLEII